MKNSKRCHPCFFSGFLDLYIFFGYMKMNWQIQFLSHINDFFQSR